MIASNYYHTWNNGLTLSTSGGSQFFLHSQHDFSYEAEQPERNRVICSRKAIASKYHIKSQLD